MNRFVKNIFLKECFFWVSSIIICLITLYFYRNGHWEGWTSAYYFSTLSFALGISLNMHFDCIRGILMRRPLFVGLILLCIGALSCVSLALPKDSVLGGILLRNIMGACIMLVLFLIVNYVDVVKLPVVGRIVSFLTGFSTEIYLYQFCFLGLWVSVYREMGVNVDLTYVFAVVVSTLFLGYFMHFVDVWILNVLTRARKHAHS